MRVSLLPLIAGLTLAAAANSAGAASVPTLEAYASAGACGGTIACVLTKDDKETPGSNPTPAFETVSKMLVDGSYADATATATFGQLHAYSDAYRVAASDAQSDADANAIEFVPADHVYNGGFNNTFVLTGSQSDGAGAFGNSSVTQVRWQDYDTTTNKELDHGQLETSDAMPQFSFSDFVAVPVGHGYETVVDLSTFTYSSYSVVDIADYSDTLHYYLTSGPGAPDVVGVSGHDYALPPAGGVPEPASWAMMVLGFAALGGLMRRPTSPLRRLVRS